MNTVDDPTRGWRMWAFLGGLAVVGLTGLFVQFSHIG